MVFCIRALYNSIPEEIGVFAKISFLLYELAEKRKFVLHPESVMRLMEIGILLSVDKLRAGGETASGRLSLQVCNSVIEKLLERISEITDGHKQDEPKVSSSSNLANPKSEIANIKPIPDERLNSVVEIEFEQFKRMSFAFQVPPSRKGSENISSGPGSFSGGSDLQPHMEHVPKTTVLSSMLARLESRKNQTPEKPGNEVEEPDTPHSDAINFVQSSLNACALYLAKCFDTFQLQKGASDILVVGIPSVLDFLMQQLAPTQTPDCLMVFLLKNNMINPLVALLLDKGPHGTKKAAALLTTIIKSYRSNLWLEIYSILNSVVIPLVSSQNTEFSLRYTLLSAVCQITCQNDLLLEFYCAFDCNSEFSDLASKLIASMCKLSVLQQWT